MTEYESWKAMEARVYHESVRKSAVACKSLAVVCSELEKMMPGGSVLREKVSATSSGDALERAALRLYEAKAAYETALAELADMHGEAVDAILMLDSPLHRAVMLAYYVAGLEWKEVGDELNYSADYCRQMRDDALPLVWEHLPRHARTMLPRAD